MNPSTYGNFNISAYVSCISYKKKPSFKSAPKVAFTLYKGAADSLELAQKLKFVKNFEKKKKDFRGAS